MNMLQHVGVSPVSCSQASHPHIENLYPKERHVLFICNANQVSSSTAEALYRATPGIIPRSAGISDSAERPVSSKLLDWAEIIFVMESYQRDYLYHRFPDVVGEVPIFCLYIPDEYAYMDEYLIHLLTHGVSQILGPPVEAKM